MTEHIIDEPIESDMKDSYLNYAMSVIVGRALPDVRDGLKPVHRRIIYAMYELSNFHNKPYKKSARIVGETLGKFHPHGDTAIYDSMVRMAQDFSLRYPLIDGQGNFGSIDGDSAAAMRYCITGDSIILTDKGILSIGDISNKQEENIKLNILSHDGKINFASKFFNSGKHKIIEVKTDLDFEIRGSYNHPLLCWVLENGIPKIKWKILADICKNDVVLLNRGSSLFAKRDFNLIKFWPKLKRTKKIKLPEKMNKDLAFLLGALVSEGSFHQKKILFNNSDIKFYKYVKNIIYNQFKGVQLYERMIAGNCLELCIYHQEAVEFLKNIGLEEVKSDKKSIPFSVLRSSKNVLTEFLKGLFEGDSSVISKIDKRHGGRSIELTYNSKSFKLINQLKIILLNLGVVTTKLYKDKRNGCYKLIISGHESIKAFKEEINFYSNKKISSLSNINSMNSNRMSKTDFIPYLSQYLRKKYKNSFIKRYNFDRYPNLKRNYKTLIKIIDNEDKKLINLILKQKYLFNTIKKITKSSKKETVYSIRVDSNCHSFVANGFINHNTEVRMGKLAEEMLKDIEKKTVDFVPNFDGTLNEPLVFPSRIPNLLLNGSSGIAVGMATNVPPHNLIEIVDALIAMIEGGDEAKILSIVTGPDFPTGGFIVGRKGINEAYKLGKGLIKLRGKAEIKDNKIIIREIPYQITKTSVIESIVQSVKEKRIEGIKGIQDHSDKKGMELVIELKKGESGELVLNQLYKYTSLESSFGIINLVLVNNEPKALGMYTLLNEFLEFRKDVLRKRSEFELIEAEDKAHILLGLKIALDNIDAVIALIKGAKNSSEAQVSLIEKYKLSEKQAKAILEMKLSRLTSLEQEKLVTDYKELLVKIEYLKGLLADINKILGLIKEELIEIKKLYGDKRRTEIIDADSDSDISIEELIAEEDVAISLTDRGYIKRVNLQEYKSQRRGGKGVRGAGTKEEDLVDEIIITHTHSHLLFFTDKGRIYWLKAYQVPESGRYATGKAIVNLLEMKEKDEKINSWISVKEFGENEYLSMVTRKGIIKRISLSSFSKPRKGGVIAITLKPGDELVQVLKTNGKQEIIIATKKGQAIRFKEEEAREIGRTGQGVIGIRLKNGDDAVVGAAVFNKPTILTITENGYGKRTPVEEYRVQGRGGSGVINIKTEGRNGHVVNVKAVEDGDQVLVMSSKGQMIRIPSEGISTVGRNTMGVRIIRLNEGEKVASFARIDKEIIKKVEEVPEPTS